MSHTENTGDAATGEGENTSSWEFNLRVVSPSVGVSGPLSFPQLSTGTTVKQLKEKIRESLSMRPSDEHQRLIHRGRLLAREDETMLDIFGQDMLKASESQTLHLVLKSSTSDSSSTQIPAGLPRQQGHPPVREQLQSLRLPPVPQMPEALRQLAEEGRQQRLAHHPPMETARDIRIPTPPHFRPSSAPQTIRFPNQQAIPNNQEHHNHQQPPLMETMRMLQEAQQETARLLQQQVHRSPGTHPNLRERLQSQPFTGMPTFQDIIAQQQQERIVLGMQGVQPNVAQQGINPIPNAGHTAHPHSHVNRAVNQPQTNTRTSIQEVTGPNGQRWTVTVNETTTVLNTNEPSSQERTTPEASRPRDIQDIIQDIVRAVDGNANAQQTRQQEDEMNSPHYPPSSTRANAGTNRPASAPPPDTSIPTSAPLQSNNARTSTEPFVPSTDGLSNLPTLNGPMVYILSSPTGPRGLLVTPSENGLEAFYTPRQLAPANTLHQNQQLQNPAQVRFDDAALGLPEVRNRREGRHGHRHGHHHAEAVAREAPGAAHPANPPAGLVAAQMWPHVWLVVRLLGFVWFFTSGSNSWWRFFAFSAVALIIFIASTGVFNGITEQVWAPVRRHLETLLPLAAPNGPVPDAPANNPAAAPNAAAGAPAEGPAEAPVGTPGAATAPPDPAQAAARLVEQRRVANENWIWTQFRRVEHATILFLASLVPGVGERHIAARVAEENLLLEAQRQRREAEAAAAEELARAAEGVQEIADDAVSSGGEGAITPVQGENETGDCNDGAGEGPGRPLIEV